MLQKPQQIVLSERYGTSVGRTAVRRVHQLWEDHLLDFQLGRSAGKNLQAQYERWQPRAKYKTHLDPTMDDVKKLAISCRRTAKVW